MCCFRRPNLRDIYCITDRPTEVRLGIYVNSFYSINEQTMVSENRCHTV